MNTQLLTKHILVHYLDKKAEALFAKIQGKPNFFLHKNYVPARDELNAVLRCIDRLIDGKQELHKTMPVLLNYLNYLINLIDKNKMDITQDNIGLIAHALLNLGNVIATDQRLPNLKAAKVMKRWASCVHFYLISIPSVNNGSASYIKNVFSQFYNRIISMFEYCLDYQYKIIGRRLWRYALKELLSILLDWHVIPGAKEKIFSNRQFIQRILYDIGTSKMICWHDEESEANPFLMYLLFEYYVMLYSVHITLNVNTDDLLSQIDTELSNMLREVKIPSGKAGKNFRLLITGYLKHIYLKGTDRENRAWKEGDFGGIYTIHRNSNLDWQLMFPFNVKLKQIPWITLRSQKIFNKKEVNRIEKIINKLDKQFHKKMQTNRQVINYVYSNNLEIMMLVDWKNVGVLFEKNEKIKIGEEIIDSDDIHYEVDGMYGNSFDTDSMRILMQINDEEPITEYSSFETKLLHEITHHLDRIYNFYGHYSDYPSKKLSWWAEGLAMYMIEPRFREKKIVLYLLSCLPKQYPSLTKMFNSDYSTCFDYVWYCSIHQFLNETGKKNKWLSIAEALRQPDINKAIADYTSILDELVSHHEQEYQDWIVKVFIPKLKAGRVIK